ncbi:hypothetical protein E2562_037592 [Oryza meyeriana var. granulata]|uniref:Uncharacterized protein n=1 Tax=Oryza meyeriana var. granulata TaxID=110450 RepID=A0A6G1E873_9ORYZ|nr:hypothetical protein E2562_037592 [Oryza meyeriana var. granulata]
MDVAAAAPPWAAAFASAAFPALGSLFLKRITITDDDLDLVSRSLPASFRDLSLLLCDGFSSAAQVPPPLLLCISFKFQAKMSLDENEFTPLSQLIHGSNGCRVRVRISRMWVSFNPNDGTVFGLDSLLIDDKGETMQARVLPKDMKQLEQRLVEGKFYTLSDFTVDLKLKNYMTCRNGLMMYIGSQTVVDEIEGCVDEIPLHSFEFVDFGDLSSRNRNNSLLTDVIGQIVYVGGIQQALKMKSLRRVLFREIQIQDLSGRIQNVTLYGDLGCHFDVELVLKKGQEAPNTRYFCRVCLKDIDCTRGWWYLGCFHCRRSISVDGNGTKFWCNGCGQNNPSPAPWYKLDAKAEDPIGNMNFMIFGEQAQELIGVAAEELVEGIEDDDRYTVPDEKVLLMVETDLNTASEAEQADAEAE